MSAEPNAVAPENSDPALPQSTSTTDTKTGKIASNTSAAPEMPGSSPVSKNLSVSTLTDNLHPKSIINTTDATLTHLNTLLKTPTGLASFLSTTNYALYILTHIHLTSPTRAALLTRLRTTLGLPASKIAPQALNPSVPSSPLLPLALAISDLRTTLRLTGLIPLYIALKTLIKSRNAAKDYTTYLIQLTQVLGYIGFQLLENITHLTSKAVIPTTWTDSRFSRLGGTAKLMTWSCRAWFVAVSCEFLRLARQTQLAGRPGSEYAALSEEKKKEADKKFWTELFVAGSWWPMALHYSVEGGVGLSLGAVGACGFFANVGNFLRLWQETRA